VLSRVARACPGPRNLRDALIGVGAGGMTSICPAVERLGLRERR